MTNTIHNHEVTDIVMNNAMFYVFLSEIGLPSSTHAEFFGDFIFYGIPVTILNNIEEKLEETKICYVVTKNGVISYDDMYTNFATINEENQDIKMSDLELIWNGGKL